MRDHQSDRYQKFESNKADWSVEYWFKIHPWIGSLGLTAKTLESHPCADDIVTLLRIRQCLWHQMTHREQATWGGYWGIVFNKHFPLNRKFWNKFTRITQLIDNRQQQLQQARQQIKNLKNKDHNSEAKGSDLSRGTYTNGNNRGAVKKLAA